MIRRFAQLFLVTCVLALPVMAQRGGGGGFHGGGMGGFHGGGGFRGGGMGGFHGGGGFRGGGFHGGFVGPGFHGGFRGFHGGFGRGWGWGWGWGYPYYTYGWGYPYYSYSYPYYGSYYYPYSYYSYPNDYSSSSGSASRMSCPQVNGTTPYQIKLTYQNDVWLTQNYWYTPGTLNFISVQGEEAKTPIDTIDRGLTEELNRNCGVHFQFPK